MSHTTEIAGAPPARPTLVNYAVVGLGLAATVWLVLRALAVEASPLASQAMVPPLFGMLGIVGLVWIAMVLMRNVLVALGKVSMRYYHALDGEPPAEWVERPARAFNNLMQLPGVFYALCLVPMTLDTVDSVMVDLAWLFVALRALHALILIGWNFVPYRFAGYATSGLALAALALQVGSRCWPAG